jgi:hypothetical protein
MSASAHIARAKRHGREFERFPDREIFQRDGYVCQCGCGLACDKTKVAPNPSAPTIGHIIALSCGGDHTRDNCECQRWGCNARQNNECDTPKAAKINRQRRVTGQQARLDRLKADGKSSRLQSRKEINSRGFDKSLRKKMNGEVVRG